MFYLILFVFGFLLGILGFVYIDATNTRLADKVRGWFLHWFVVLFCVFCALPLLQGEEGTHSDDASDSRWSLGLFILSMVILLGTLFFLGKRGGSGKKSTTERPSPPLPPK